MTKDLMAYCPLLEKEAEMNRAMVGMFLAMAFLLSAALEALLQI